MTTTESIGPYCCCLRSFVCFLAEMHLPFLFSFSSVRLSLSMVACSFCSFPFLILPFAFQHFYFMLPCKVCFVTAVASFAILLLRGLCWSGSACTLLMLSSLSPSLPSIRFRLSCNSLSLSLSRNLNFKMRHTFKLVFLLEFGFESKFN